MRVINGGERIHREYGLERKHTDLFLELLLDPKQGLYSPKQKVVIEVKLIRDKQNSETVKKEGVLQTRDYAQKVGAHEAHLILFDRRARITWDQRIYRHLDVRDGYPVTVWGT